jgi:hypothetical protein
MNKDIMEQVMPTVDSEGFDYAFCSYSSFKEIKDVKFHELREEYVKAAQALKDYIGYDEY